MRELIWTQNCTLNFISNGEVISGTLLLWIKICGGKDLLNNINNIFNETENIDELEKLYQIYKRCQSGDKDALDELFESVENKQVCKLDDIYKKHRMTNMDNVLDSEEIMDKEKSKQEDEWANSQNSKITFRLSCLNKMLYKKKKGFLSKVKNTGYENGVKLKNCNCSKFYDGEYDLSDFNEIMYWTIIEIFNKETGADNCLTLYGKTNKKVPICDGISLLKNIAYFTSIKINERAGKSYLDISDIVNYGDKSEEDEESEISNFDKYAFDKFFESKSSGMRLLIYEECLEWIKRNNVHKLFKLSAHDIKAIFETIMNVKDTFIMDIEDGVELGLGMHLVKQKVLQEIIRHRHNINVEQGNLSRDLEIIEQRLLDHLFYSLNYKIDKAEESSGIYEKESERFLYKTDHAAYIKMFNRTSYTVYKASVAFINSSMDGKDYNGYFELVKEYDDLVMDIVSLEKGKKKYDMCNLMVESNNDLVEDKRIALINIANTIIAYCQNEEKGYVMEKLGEYRKRKTVDFANGYWETILENEVLSINTWSSKRIKKPIRHRMGREKLMIYCGYMNFYICDMENKIYYSLPKDRRIISRANKNHEIKIYNID